MQSNIRQILWDRLRLRGDPVFVFDVTTIPAASIWAGSRLWLNAAREAGLEPLDPVVLALPPSPAFLQVVVASLWDGWALTLVEPGAPMDPDLAPRVVIGEVQGDVRTPRWAAIDLVRPGPPPRLEPAARGPAGVRVTEGLLDEEAVLQGLRGTPELDADGVLRASVCWTSRSGVLGEVLPALGGQPSLVLTPGRSLALTPGGTR